MKSIRPGLSAALVAFALAAAPAAASENETFQEKVKVMAGETLYKEQCRRCHAPDSDHESYGPALSDVIGRRAGSVAGYEYSEALKTASFVWTTGALRAWMEDNTGFLPGTKMRHVGISDPTVQDFIITYLESLPAGN